MHILIVSQYYYPEQFQINEIAPELVRRGHDVTVLTGLPNYPLGELYSGYENGNKREEIIEGVHVIRVYEHPRRKGVLHLLLNYFSFMISGSRKAKTIKDKYDVVLCYQLSPVLMIRPAIAYASKKHVPLIVYCLDIWPESARAHLSNKIFFNLIKFYSQKLYRACDFIAVTSRPFIDYLSQVNHVARAKLGYLPQHADGKLLDMDLSSADDGIVDFMYAGNMGKGQTLEVIVKATAELKSRNDFKVHMVGDGSQRHELEQLAQNLGVADTVVFYGNQKRDDMPSFYKKADVLLLTLRGDNAVGNTMPGKLQVYMTTGKPILGAINGAAAEVISEAKCGECVPAGDFKGLAGLMLKYIEHRESFADCGENAKIYFNLHFTLKKYCDDLEQLLVKFA